MLQALSLLAAGGCDKSGGFLGLLPWWHYLPSQDFTHGCDIGIKFQVLGTHSGFALILLAVVDDLLRIAALVTLGYVFYGAIQYITSQGNAEATARAQSTIQNALVGLAIALISVAAVSFIGSNLGRS